MGIGEPFQHISDFVDRIRMGGAAVLGVQVSHISISVTLWTGSGWV